MNSLRRVKLVSPVNTVIIVANVLVFIWFSIIGDTNDTNFMYYHGANYWPAVFLGKEYYRLFTCGFIHFGISHLFNNMLVLGYIGDNLERALGKIKYIILYTVGLVGSSIVSCGWAFIKSSGAISGGASGAIFAVVGAMLVIVIKNKGRLEDISSRQIKFFIIFSIYHGVTSAGTDNAAHIGGLLIGALLGFLLYRKKRQTWEYTDY